MQHSVKTNYMYVQQLIFFSCFVNIHITDIWTIDLQKKPHLFRKLFEELSVQKGYPFGSRSSAIFSSSIIRFFPRKTPLKVYLDFFLKITFLRTQKKSIHRHMDKILLKKIKCKETQCHLFHNTFYFFNNFWNNIFIICQRTATFLLI